MMPWLACAFVRAVHGHAQALRRCSEMTSFTSRWRMRVHPAGDIAKDASAHAMTGGLSIPIVYPLLVVLQASLTSTHQQR